MRFCPCKSRSRCTGHSYAGHWDAVPPHSGASSKHTFLSWAKNCFVSPISSGVNLA